MSLPALECDFRSASGTERATFKKQDEPEKIARGRIAARFGHVPHGRTASGRQLPTKAGNVEDETGKKPLKKLYRAANLVERAIINGRLT